MNTVLCGNRGLDVLEAGCGSASYFCFVNVRRMVGIDISDEQLKRNQGLQEKICGDLQTYPLPVGAFDIVVCWDVIEHLSRPRDALINMFGCIKPGGVLVLGFPNLASIKGVVTKFTPFWFHELFYHVMKYESRHFPTYLRRTILPGRVQRLARENGFSVIFQSLHEGGVSKRFKRRFPPAKAVFGALDVLAHTVSLGKLQSLQLDNCAFVLRKVAA